MCQSVPFPINIFPKVSDTMYTDCRIATEGPMKILAPCRPGRLLLGSVLAVMMAVSSGCALGVAVLGVGAGAGAVAYTRGDTERNYPYPIDLVFDASMAALAQSEVSIGNYAKDQLKGQIEANTATGDKIKIILASQGNVTTVSVRVNTFGNKHISSTIAQKIDTNIQYAVSSGQMSQEMLSSRPVAPLN